MPALLEGGFEPGKYYIVNKNNLDETEEVTTPVTYTLCRQNEDIFDYHGIENALCGKQPDEEEHMYFSPKRILVIQMK